MRIACGENIRDNLVLELFLATGCRVSEVVGMRVEEIDLESGSVKVLGKGQKFRISLSFGEMPVVKSSIFLSASFCLVLHTIKTKIQVPLGPFIIHKIQNHRKEGCQMEKIKIHDTEYEIISIMPAATNVLRIEFADAVPEKWGDITHIQLVGWKPAASVDMTHCIVQIVR